MTTQTEALKLAISRLEWFIDSYPHDIKTSKEDFLRPFKEALAQPELCKYGQERKSCTSSPMDCQCVIDAALAQPEQEPVRIMGFNCVCGRRMEVSAEQGVIPATNQKQVAWGVFDGLNLHDMFFTEEEAQEMTKLKGDGSVVKPLYTTPPQRKPLTDEQIKDIRVACGSPLAIHMEFARAIEAAHGIKE